MANYQSKSWPYLTHHVGNTLDVAKFDSKRLVGERVEYLRTQRDKETSRRNWALSKGVPVKTLERIEKASNAITLDSLDELADAVGVEPWQLITPLPPEIAEIAAQLNRITDPMAKRIAIAQCAAAAFAEVEEPPAGTEEVPSAPAPAPQATPKAKAKGA
jgi:transcriptional regulator with XRE-family HTH domain